MTWTELHDACEHRDANRIFRVVKENAEQVIQVDDHGWTPLHILCWDPPGVDPIIALLEAYPEAASHQDLHGNSPLHILCSRPKTDKHLVSVLLSTCPSLISMVNHEGLMPLHIACRYIPQNAGVIGLLIEQDPNALRTHIKVNKKSTMCVLCRIAILCIKTYLRIFVSSTQLSSGVILLRANEVQVVAKIQLDPAQRTMCHWIPLAECPNLLCLFAMTQQ